MAETGAQTDFEERRRLLQMRMLYEVGLAINGSLELSQVSQEILERALTMVDARAGALWVRDSTAGWEVVGRIGHEAQTGGPAAQAAVAEAWKRRRLVQADDAGGGWQHLCAVPLESGQQVDGVLVVTDREQRRGGVGPFNSGDQALLLAFALQAGSALHNAQLYRRLEQAYEQLQAAQRKLAQLEHLKALGDLSAEVAHAVRHILGIIVGRADLYLSQPHDPEAAVRAILQTAESGEGILERLQRCTRLGVGHAREAVDVAQLAAASAADVQALWAERDRQAAGAVQWQVDCQPVPSTWGNGTDLQDVLRNLLVNALEAMPAGGRLRLGVGGAEGRIVVDVEDDGVGMSQDICARVFEPFFTTKELPGSGLGLSIAYRIVEDHGGELAVRSKPGSGSCFTVSLPVVAAPASGGMEDAQTDFDR
jgi:signal transduction histidine kinase